jgi:hypothetical protein
VSRAAWRRVLAALAALTLAWLIAPASVPIYDGVGNPDEPYRYVSPPAGAKKTPAPTVAKATLTVTSAGLDNAQYANSAEVAPQVVYYVPNGAMKAPTGASAITVTATPLAPTAPLPADGTIVGNVYRIAATTSKGDAVIVGHGITQLPTLDMRAPTGKQPGPVFEHVVSGAWQHSNTLRIGVDVYQTSAGALGDWALVQLKSQPGKSSGINVGLLAAGIAVLVIVVLIIAIRLSRTRRTR